MNRRILIIKLGALGDVIRTTPLLRVIEGHITWVTSSAALPLLQNNRFIDRLLIMDQPGFRLDGRYDLVANLEDDSATAALASAVGSDVIIGPYLSGGRTMYSPGCGGWFDMSLSSRYDRAAADQLKMRNRRSYQDLIFSAFGLTFRGEEPVLDLPLRKRKQSGLVGIEARAGGVWPTKRWTGYEEIAGRLRLAGYTVTFFRQRENIVDYADDIHECEIVICGDTLAMHFGLALQKKVVALFTCTSPHEICDYGRMKKVISPLLEQHFYKREYSQRGASAIPVTAVEEAFVTLTGRHTPVTEVRAGERANAE